MPAYEVRVRKQHGRVPVPFVLDGPHLRECPRSLATQSSDDLVRLVGTITSAHDAAGAAVAADQMPGYVLDALQLVAREKRAIEHAQQEAVENS